MTDLSPAAQAVLDAANGASSYDPDDCLNDARQIAAATLRAAADRVVPEASELLAIADELEGQANARPPSLDSHRDPRRGRSNHPHQHTMTDPTPPHTP